jgi:PBSX family phage terminase large subunit
VSRVETIEYDPLPVFEPFHTSSAREALIVGGYGSGKSVGGSAEIIKQALEQPGSEWLVARKTINSLRDTTEKVLLNMLPPGFLKESHLLKGGGHVQQITFPNGSLIHFKGLDDWKKIKSLNLAGFFFDEADEIDWETYVGVKTRVRQVHPLPGSTAPPGTVIRSGVIRVAMNPNGHDPYWDYFIKGQPRDGKVIGSGDRMAFLSTSLDNPYNPISYINDLLAMPEPWVRRYVFCSFEDFQGVIYPEWDWGSHVVDPYGYYAPTGLFMMGMDPGTQNPTAAIWCYFDREIGKLVGIAEYAEVGTAVSMHVNEWRKIEAAGTHNLTRRPGRMNVRRRIADPSIATRDRGSMASLENQYARKGYVFEHGPKNIPDRLPALAELIHRGQFVITKELERTYEQIKQYRYEDLTPDQIGRGVEAKPFKRHVDLVDATQYVASRHIAPNSGRTKKLARTDVRVQNAHDVEMMMRVKSLREEGMHDEADMLERELIPDGVMVDARQGLVRRRARPLRTDQSAGLV